MSTLHQISKLLTRFDVEKGTVEGALLTERRLSDLRGCFQSSEAFERALAIDNPVVYSVASVEVADAEGDLHFGLGTLRAGCVGDEYFLTKGHLHSWRAAAEIYVGLAGEGAMLLEDEATGVSKLIALQPNSVVYVPGHTAHRTINTGDVPLVYLGIYPAHAGHDYGAIAQRNFRCALVKRDGRPQLIQRNH